MTGKLPFDAYHCRYDNWYDMHSAAYCSELLAVRSLLPWQGIGLEIGVGTGRFAAPLGVRFGVDPSASMLEYAHARGVRTVLGIAEQLPFATDSFDCALSVATICFVDDVRAMLREARRVIKPGGCLVLGFVDRGSALGQQYLNQRAENDFYREATSYSADEVEDLLLEGGFPLQEWVQTLSAPLPDIVEIEPFRAGHGNDAFVVVKAMEMPTSAEEDRAKRDDIFHRVADFLAD